MADTLSQMGGDMAARVQLLEDRFALNDLVATYCRAIDDRDLDVFVSLFAESARVRHEDGSMLLEGQAAIRAYYQERFPTYGVTVHSPHSQTVTFHGPDSATGVVVGHAEMGLNGEFVVAAFRYSDHYVRHGGRWRFAERVLACWYYMRLADLPTGMRGALRKHYKGQLMAAELPESLASYQAWHGAALPGVS